MYHVFRIRAFGVCSQLQQRLAMVPSSLRLALSDSAPQRSACSGAGVGRLHEELRGLGDVDFGAADGAVEDVAAKAQWRYMALPCIMFFRHESQRFAACCSRIWRQRRFRFA